MTVPDFLTDPARACRGVDPELFFAAYEGRLERAKEICSACPFQTPCLRYAVDNEERYGVFGGVLFSSETERDRAKRAVNGDTPARMDVPAVAPPNRRIGPSPCDSASTPAPSRRSAPSWASPRASAPTASGWR
jgi:hypothetical protein